MIAKTIGILAAIFPCSAVACPGPIEFAPGLQIGTINSSKVTEASGIAVSRTNSGVFWTHNDGSTDKVYAFRFDGTLLATFALSKSTTDLEDIAVGPGPAFGVNYLYVGDIGSNNADRDEVKVFRIEEPKVDPAWAQNPVSRDFSKVAVCRLKYPDGTYDAETLMIDYRESALFIGTKENTGTRIYRAPLSALVDGQTATLTFVARVDFTQASGGAISADGSLIALRREEFALAWPRSASEMVADALSRAPLQIPVMAPPDEPNGEGISFLPDGSGYVTISEGASQPIYLFQALPSSNDAPQFSAMPQSTPQGLRLEFRACVGKSVIVERSTNFSTWTQIGTVQVIAESSVFIDSASTGTRFYRLRNAN